MTDHRHAWRADTTQVGSVCYDCGLTQHDWFFDEQRRLQAENERLRAALVEFQDRLTAIETRNAGLQDQQAEIERLQAALLTIEEAVTRPALTDKQALAEVLVLAAEALGPHAHQT